MKVRAIADYRGEDMEDNINIIGEAKNKQILTKGIFITGAAS